MRVQSQIDELLALRASEWLEILKNPTDAERAAFIEWLGESRRHVLEFLQIAAVDDVVGTMPAEMRENVNDLLARLTPSVARLPGRARPLIRDRSARAPRFPGTSWQRAGLAAAGAAAVLTIALFAHLGHPTRYETDIGEQRTIALADASVITLNADSQIQLNLDDARRDVDLRRGEAIFNVARDNRRPFRVRTRAGTVQAIGTQFNVYAHADGDTRVSVLEGRVQLTALPGSSGPAPRTSILDAGEEADLRLDGTIRRNARAAVENAVSWRQRRLAFSDALLEDIIVEFNRYNRSPRLRLEGVPRETYRFAGVFDATDPQSLTELLAREPGLVVDRHEREIVIRAR